MDLRANMNQKTGATKPWTTMGRQLTISSYAPSSHLASTTGFIELLPSPKQPVKDNEDVVSDWLPIFRCTKRKLHPGHSPAMNLQCTLKLLKYSLPTLLLEFMVHSRFITYYPCVYTSPTPLYTPMAVSLGLNLKAPAASFTSKCLKNI